MEAGPTYTGILYEERMTRGIMAVRGERVVWDSNCVKHVVGNLGSSEEIQAMIKKNDWNDYLVRAEGNHLQHFINGRQTVDVTDDCEAKRAMKGVLALQLHQGGAMKVEFRDLRLKQTSGGHEASAEEIKPLQGAWQVIGLEAEGSVLAPEMVTNIYVTITDNVFHVFNAGEDASGSFTVDATKQPKQMVIHCETGPDKGQTWPGIYEIGKETFRVCYSRTGKKAPGAFATAEDGGLVMINYKRKKA